MRRALTVGAPLLTRFAREASSFDNIVRPWSHIIESVCRSRGKKQYFAGKKS